MEVNIQELLKNYPYLQGMIEDKFLISPQNYQKYKDGRKIKVGERGISVDLLQDILLQEEFNDYIKRLFSGEIKKFMASYIINGDLVAPYSLSRVEIVNGISMLLFSKDIENNEINLSTYNELKDAVSYNYFLEEYKEINYSLVMDGQSFTIPFNQIVSFLELDEEEFYFLCENQDSSLFFNMDVKYFAHAVNQFIVDNQILENYIFPRNILSRYHAMLRNIDIEAINQILETNDKDIENVVIDKEFKCQILDGIPKDSLNLEKAIYIYIKMCKLLTYDEEYYVFKQHGEVAEKHKDINYISKITSQNNAVVCFEFNLIYAKLLDELGIKLETSYKNLEDGSYGEGHANLIFRNGKYLVLADSVTSILQGDLVRAKLNQPLIGLKCLNQNSETIQEFSGYVSKMYTLISKQEHSIKDKELIGHIDTFDELVEEYSKQTDNKQDVSLNEKLDILISKVNSKNMKGIDSLSYILQLQKILFTEKELKENIEITIIKNNETSQLEKNAVAGAVIAINIEGFNNENSTVYYYYDYRTQLISLSKDIVQSKFDNGLFEYVDNSDPRVPWVLEKGRF